MDEITKEWGIPIFYRYSYKGPVRIFSNKDVNRFIYYMPSIEIHVYGENMWECIKKIISAVRAKEGAPDEYFIEIDERYLICEGVLNE